MKKTHREIMNKLETYLNQEGSEHLRFWQALYNCDMVIENKRMDRDNKIILPITIKDDYNISDNELIKRLK